VTGALFWDPWWVEQAGKGARALLWIEQAGKGASGN